MRHSHGIRSDPNKSRNKMDKKARATPLRIVANLFREMFVVHDLKYGQTFAGMELLRARQRTCFQSPGLPFVGLMQARLSIVAARSRGRCLSRNDIWRPGGVCYEWMLDSWNNTTSQPVGRGQQAWVQGPKDGSIPLSLNTFLSMSSFNRKAPAPFAHKGNPKLAVLDE